MPRTCVDEASKSAESGRESASGRCWEKNWWRRRSGALRGGWDARTGGAEHVVVDAAWSAGRLKAEGVVEELSGVEEEVFWGSLLLEKFKNLPLNGFENRE